MLRRTAPVTSRSGPAGASPRPERLRRARIRRAATRAGISLEGSVGHAEIRHRARQLALLTATAVAVAALGWWTVIDAAGAGERARLLVGVVALAVVVFAVAVSVRTARALGELGRLVDEAADAARARLRDPAHRAIVRRLLRCPNAMDGGRGEVADAVAAGRELLGARCVECTLDERWGEHVHTVAGHARSASGREVPLVTHVRSTAAPAIGSRAAAVAPLRGRGAIGPTMAVPVVAYGDVIGVVLADAPDGEHFDDDDLVTLELVADVVASTAVQWRARREEQEQVAALLEAERVRREFGVIAAHELRTPITVLRAASGSARRAGLPPADAEALWSVIEAQTERFERMAEDLVAEWRRLATVRVRVAPVQLTDLIDGTVGIWRRAGITVDWPGDTPCLVLANAEVVRRVLFELVATTDSRRSATTRVRIERDARHARLVVVATSSEGGAPPTISATSRRLLRGSRADPAIDRVGEETVFRLALPRAASLPVERAAADRWRPGALVEVEVAPTMATAPAPSAGEAG